MGTFGIDVDMGLLKGGSPDDIDSCRTSLIRLRWRVSRWCDACLNFVFLHFFSWPAPFDPGGHPGEPWPEAAYWSLSWDHSSWESGQTAAEILIAFKAGVDIFFSWFFPFVFAESQFQTKKLSVSPPPCNRGALNITHLLRLIRSSWLPTTFICQYKE